MICLTAFPFFTDAVEKSVWIVIFSALEFDHKMGIFAHQKSNDIPRTTKMCSIQITIINWQLKISTLEIS